MATCVNLIFGLLNVWFMTWRWMQIIVMRMPLEWYYCVGIIIGVATVIVCSHIYLWAYNILYTWLPLLTCLLCGLDLCVEYELMYCVYKPFWSWRVSSSWESSPQPSNFLPRKTAWWEYYILLCGTTFICFKCQTRGRECQLVEARVAIALLLAQK